MNKEQAAIKKAEWLAYCLKVGWTKDQLDDLSNTWDRFKDEYGNLRKGPITATTQPSPVPQSSKGALDSLRYLLNMGSENPKMQVGTILDKRFNGKKVTIREHLEQIWSTPVPSTDVLREALVKLIYTVEKLWDEVKPIKDSEGIKVTHPVIEIAKSALSSTDDGWVKVEDRLPEVKEGEDNSENVFAIVEGYDKPKVMAYCYINSGHDDTTGKDLSGWAWCDCNNQIDGDPEFDDEYKVTRWRPFPSPPITETKPD